MVSNISSEMHIALCVDSNYLPYCCCTIESVISNHSSASKITFYIVHFSNVEDISILLDHINKSGHRGVDIEVSDSEILNFLTVHHITSS